MKKHLLLLSIFFVFCAKGFALEIVYPKTNPAKINASSTFFIGSTNPSDTLKINDFDVKVYPSGAFAQVVPLNVGLNNFKIISSPSSQSPAASGEEKAVNPSIIDFIIERAQPQAAPLSTLELIEYSVINNFYVKNDNTPLRMTPLDGGINRMSHLPKGMQVPVNGEKGDFYRVYLNSKLSGWLAKSGVEQRQAENNEFLPIKIIDFNIKEDNEFCIYEVNLDDGQTPFIVKEENGGLSVQLFNILAQDDCTFSFNVPMQKLLGYDAYYEKNKFILKVRKFPKINPERPLKNIIIAVDAGHGGSEFGAIGALGDKEKDINLAIAKELKSELGNRGAKVIMTREDDIDLSLADRVKITKEKNAVLLLSIHANALPDEADPNKNRGTSVYYYHNQAKSLAQSILNSMTTQLCTQNDKVRQGSLALVRPTFCVSVLIEVAYIINPDDYALLLDKNFRANCAKAIADGIEKYMLQIVNIN